ncbi:hypothetical protein GCM10009119_26200 [Algoriphagus jejuensis]|uniref:Uncharacterized protein n=2 Tax=Algoriphagus jejuensis TaxID=419934 RepID=A0ABN1N218_9BACT
MKAEAELQRKDDSLKIWDPNRREHWKTYDVHGFQSTFTAINRDGLFNAIAGWEYVFRFRGECAEQILLETSIFSVFDETLMASVDSVLAPIVKGFVDQCDQVKIIRVKIQFKNNEVYRGTLSKKTAWSLVPNWEEESDDFKVDITTPNYLHNYLGATYKGKCEDNIYVLILLRNQSDIWRQNASFSNMEEVANAFVEEYSAQCGKVNQINFILPYAPAGYYCEGGTKCSMVARKEDGWQLTFANTKTVGSRTYLVKNYLDFFDYFSKDVNTNALMEYSDYFKVFYEDFIEVYGDICKENLGPYTTFEIQTVSTKYDLNGVPYPPEKVGPPQVVNIENQNIARYRKFGGQNNQLQMEKMLSAEVQSRQSNSTGGYLNVISRRLSERNSLTNYVIAQCGSQSFKDAYDRINLFAKRLD